jgi:hypothetical protein
MHSKILVFVFSCILLIATNANAETKYAWWVTAEFEPKNDNIENIPVNKIDKSWDKAEALSWKRISKDGLEKDLDTGSIDLERYNFFFTGDFNNDGKQDKAIVGVYKNKNGQTGTFLLILSRANTGKWEKSFLKCIDGKPGFSILWKAKEGFDWCSCLECDHCAEIRWNGKEYIVDWGSEEDYP